MLSPPGLGDDIQAIKAGILEIADIHVVSKADKPEAGAAVAALKGMLALGTSRSDSTWKPPVIAVSSVSGEQMETLKATIGKHWTHLHESGEFAARQRKTAGPEYSTRHDSCSSSSSKSAPGSSSSSFRPS